MSGVIRKLYHPTSGGTVTTLQDSSLQELYPIVSTTGVISPEGGFHANDNLDQILRWLDANKISGTGLKTLTVNGVEQSLIGSGTIIINGGGGGSSILDQYLGFDAEKGAVYVKNNYGFYSNSFISAGGVGSGGGGDDPSETRYRGVSRIDYAWDPNNPSSAQYYIHTVLPTTAQNYLALWEGNGISISETGATTAGQVRFAVKLQNNGGLAFNNNGELYATGGSTPYNLPIASASQLGGIMVGSGLSINSAGVLSATGSSYSLPTASATRKGGIKVGTDLSMSGEILNVDRSTLKGYLDGYFVHLTGAETVNGLKTFVDGIAIGNNTKTITLVNGEIVINGDVKVNGNFYATGNVTAGSSQ